MERYEIGSFVFSKAGHDKNEVYVILKNDGTNLYVADGRLKTVEKPKKKNIRHVQWINYSDDSLLNKIQKGEKVTNEEIKYAIKCYRM